MDETIERRNFLRTASLAAVAAATLAAPPAFAQGSPAPAPKPATYEIKPLARDAKNVKGLREKILLSHHDNNYAGAVKRLNAITAQPAALVFTKAPVFVANGLKREQLIAMNSMILHEIYFDRLAGGGALAEAIVGDFGSVDRWRDEFSAMGKAEGGGSAWVILAYSPHDRRLVNSWAADHTMTLADGRPIVALDMYEHAYHMDYGAKAAAYVDAFMDDIRWDNAGRTYERVSREA